MVTVPVRVVLTEQHGVDGVLTACMVLLTVRHGVQGVLSVLTYGVDSAKCCSRCVDSVHGADSVDKLLTVRHGVQGVFCVVSVDTWF